MNALFLVTKLLFFFTETARRLYDFRENSDFLRETYNFARKQYFGKELRKAANGPRGRNVKTKNGGFGFRENIS